MRTDDSLKKVEKKEIFGWAMFDFANSSYTTVVITAIYSGFFTEYIVPKDSQLRDSYWSIAILVSTLVALVFSPLIGAICDYAGHKKKFLGATAVGCSVFTMLLYFVHPGQVWLAIGLIVLSYAGFMFSETFCGSFLPDISTSKNIGKISGLGWAIGYFGGLASLVLCKGLIVTEAAYNFDQFVHENQKAMLATGMFFLLAAIPTFVFLKERSLPKRGFEKFSLSKLFAAGWKEFTLSSQTVKQNRQLFRFFLAFAIYSAGLNAVINFVGIYARGEVALNLSQIMVMFLGIQLSGALGAFAFGIVEDKLGPKQTVMLSIAWWICAVLLIIYLQEFAGLLGTTPQNAFIGICLLAGAGMGALQSSSRAVVGLLSPPDKVSQIFGFWGSFSRLAMMLGSGFGILADLINSRRLALWLLVLFFVIGGYLLSKLDLKHKHNE